MVLHHRLWAEGAGDGAVPLEEEVPPGAVGAGLLGETAGDAMAPLQALGPTDRMALQSCLGEEVEGAAIAAE